MILIKLNLMVGVADNDTMNDTNMLIMFIKFGTKFPQIIYYLDVHGKVQMFIIYREC